MVSTGRLWVVVSTGRLWAGYIFGYYFVYFFNFKRLICSYILVYHISVLKEFITFIISIIILLLVGIFVNFSNFDLKLAEASFGKDFKKKTLEYTHKKSDNNIIMNNTVMNNIVMKVMTVKVIMNDGEKLVNVDPGTSQLEIMAVFGKKFENILTISNYFKIINNGDVIDVR